MREALAQFWSAIQSVFSAVEALAKGMEHGAGIIRDELEGTANEMAAERNKRQADLEKMLAE
jgi:hypothetical protein